MKNEIFLIAVIYFTAATSVNTTITTFLPKLPYSPNGTLIWFPSIRGGTPVKMGDFHGQASLQTRNGSHICSATLISIEHVLTAAHCVTDEKGSVLRYSNLQVIADCINMAQPYSNATQIRYPVNIVVHPLFNISNYQNDYAIIRLNSKFNETSTLYPMDISVQSPTPDKKCKLAAWGNIKEKSGSRTVLKKFDYEVLNTYHCNSAQFFNGLVPLHSFCVSVVNDLPGACQMDSGGALICENHITGIVSFGYACIKPSMPIVLGDVTIQNQWVVDVIKQQNFNTDGISTKKRGGGGRPGGRPGRRPGRPGGGSGGGGTGGGGNGGSSIKYSLLLLIMSFLILCLVE